jgi:hypothetical protein
MLSSQNPSARGTPLKKRFKLSGRNDEEKNNDMPSSTSLAD